MRVNVASETVPCVWPRHCERSFSLQINHRDVCPTNVRDDEATPPNRKASFTPWYLLCSTLSPPLPALLSHFLPSPCSRQTLCYRLSHSKLVSYLPIQASDITILFVVINQSMLTRNGDGIYKCSEPGDCRGTATVVWYHCTRRHAVHWLLNTTLWRCYHGSGRSSLNVQGGRRQSGGLAVEIFVNCSPQTGKKSVHTVLSPANYWHTFSAASVYYMEKMNMLYKEQCISILHSVQFVSTAQHNVPLFMDLEFQKGNKREGLSEKSWNLAVLSFTFTAHCSLVVVIGSFNVVRGFRWRA